MTKVNSVLQFDIHANLLLCYLYRRENCLEALNTSPKFSHMFNNDVDTMT